jgi:hypothetical protein
MSLRRRILFGVLYAGVAFAVWWLIVVAYFFAASFVLIPRGVELPVELDGPYGWAAFSGIAIFPIAAFISSIRGWLPGTRPSATMGFPVGSVRQPTFPLDEGAPRR